MVLKSPTTWFMDTADEMANGCRVGCRMGLRHGKHPPGAVAVRT